MASWFPYKSSLSSTTILCRHTIGFKQWQIGGYIKNKGYKKIMEARALFLKANVGADEIFKESRRQLEERP
jgi:hypothetical protein